MNPNFKNVTIGVANRGVPALRVGRTIREIGAKYAAFFTPVDRTAPHVSKADKAFSLSTVDGYLDIEEIVRIAKRRDIAALHPGWGFAAENNHFPYMCEEYNIVFIGPSEKPMKSLGNKVKARSLAKSNGVPVIEGSDSAVSVDEAKELAEKIGFPIMLKSEGGGGGRGVVVVDSQDELADEFSTASSMAEASFGNPNLYVEQFLPVVRHLEIQVICDKFGNAVALDERDCSCQRRYQKLLEITPSPWKGMTPELRQALKEAALKMVTAVEYDSIITIEFLVDEKGNFYFIEANTRLQVEHGITELLYGIDIVEEMIRIAFGQKLRLTEDQLTPKGYAMQCRINFEDPQNDFMPNSGTITRYLSPGGEGVRVDSCVFGDYEFPKAYDSLGSLLMTYGRTWGKTTAIMERALSEYFIDGLKTTVPFHKKIVTHPEFKAGEIHTRFIGQTPDLVSYRDVLSEHLRTAKLIAEITAMGHNPYLGLGRYRKFEDTRLGPMPQTQVSSSGKGKKKAYEPPFKPDDHREVVLNYLRNSEYVEFCNTTPRDVTQSESGNRFRLYDDRRTGPLLDQCGYVSIENGGGAHYHVAMLGCMTDPWMEAEEWNRFAPHTQKMILIRSTNILGYAPQSREVMARTGRMIAKHYHVIRCFDFLNHIENMVPFAEIVLQAENRIFQPAISMSWAEGFTVEHYLSVLDDILSMVGRVLDCGKDDASKQIILGLKDMAGVCPPRFISALISSILDQYPELVVQYHRHKTDGLAVPSLGSAAKAGAKILDVADGPAVRFYSQAAVLPVAAYVEGELGLKTRLDKDKIREAGFALKQVMPVYDAYCRPTFLGPDHDVTRHGLPGGATSSSQEAAMKQGHAFLLPHILLILELCRKIIRYHDVTPGSQITWTNGYMMAAKAYERGGMPEVQRMIDLLKAVTGTPEDELDDQTQADRLILFSHANDAFKNLLLGKFGKLPLGWPADWVYRSAFGEKWRDAQAKRTEESPLNFLPPVDMEATEKELAQHIGRTPTENEIVNYLNHPGDALKLIKNLETYGDPNHIPDDIWFEGLKPGTDREFATSDGKVHTIKILRVGRVRRRGTRRVRYQLDYEVFVEDVKVAPSIESESKEEMANPDIPFHIAAPFDADLWKVTKKPGDAVRAGEEVMNLSVMKTECAVTAPLDGVVKRVVMFADYKEDKKMVPVKKGQLLMELGPVMELCRNCNAQVMDDYDFCPKCGIELESEQS